MNLFTRLGEKIEKTWQLADGSLEAFTKLSTQALADFSYSLSSIELDQALAASLLEIHALPQQVALHNTFGQPPLTLFNNGKFVVDLYIWVNFDTSIHSHGFRGAFR